MTSEFRIALRRGRDDLVEMSHPKSNYGLSFIGAILVAVFVFFCIYIMRVYLRHTHQCRTRRSRATREAGAKKLRESQSGGGGRTLDTSVSPG